MKKSGLTIWVLLRLPILAAGLYLFRFQIATVIDDAFGLGTAIDFVVFSASTFWTRFIIYLACVSALTLGTWLVKKWMSPELLSYILLLTGAFIAIYFSFVFIFLTPNPLIKTSVVTIILAVNTIPEKWLTKWMPRSRLMNLFFLAGVGWSEAFFPQIYIFWLVDKFQAGNSIKKWSWLSGVMIAPLFWIFLLTPYDNQRILTLGEKLHASPAVEKFTEGNFNWIEFNTKHKLLYAVGRGTNFLLAFDTAYLDQPPRRSKTDIGKTQSFAFNPDLQELYVYKAETGELLYLDALNLETFRSVPVTDLSPGDVWVNWQRGTDSITIASEADLETGTPFEMISRASGETIAAMPLPLIPTNITFHPDKDILYFNSFRDTYFISWDMDSHEVIQRVATSPRTDRLIFSSAYSEVLIASPLEGVILRYDADTLEFKGSIKASVGDRTLAIDPQRNLLLVGNFINNRLQVIDLNTCESVASFYIGPWIRTISLDVERGIAYVSTVRNLFKVRYTSNE
ncbi:MAG: YncE family protein [Anaerolineales bacterium]